MSCDPSKTCTICDQRGLPILPLRYAVARNDVAAGQRAPDLQKPFDDGVTGVSLPGENADYTLRLLRPGYLYVFNEKRGEWKAYVVNDQAYLLEFDAHGKAPPNVGDAKACARMRQSAGARCVMIPDAGNAGAVWLGFSDTAWTPAVMARHRSEAYRARHMQRIDVAAWANAGANPKTQSHMERLDKGLGTQVAEYALPAGAKRFPALDYSPHEYHNQAHSTEALVETANAAAGKSVAAMVALNDPVGIALEISELIRYQIRAFEAKDDRAWKKATSDALQGLREAIQANAADQALARHRAKRYSVDEFGIPMYPAHSEAQRSTLDRMFATLPAEEEARVRESAWRKYLDDYSESKRIQFETQLKTDFEALIKDKLAGLADAFAGWYRSARFRNVLECTHDEHEIASGENLTVIVSACLTEITGLRAVAEAVIKDLSGSYSDPGNPGMRAMVLNNADAAKVLDEAAVPALELGNPGAWSNAFKAFAHVIDGADKTKTASKEELAAALGSVAKLAYQMSGPIVQALGRAGRAAGDAASTLAVGIATRYRMMAFLGVISGRPLRALQVTASERGMAHAVVEALTEGHKGVDKSKLRKQLDAELAADTKGDSGSRASTGSRNARGRKKFNWTVFWDDASRQALGSGVDPTRLNDMVLSQRQLERLVQSRTRKFIKVDIGLGTASLILDGWNAYDAFGKLEDEKEGTADQRQLGLAAALVGMTGSSVELVGGVMQRTRWGGTALARPFTFFANKVATRAALIGFCGRLAGAAGGFLGGALDLWKAWDAWKRGDLPAAAFFTATGLSALVVGGLMVAGVMTLGVGFVVLIVLALLSLLGGWLIDLFTDNDIEKWVDQTPFGNQRHGRFKAIGDQVIGWNKVIAGAGS